MSMIYYVGGSELSKADSGGWEQGPRGGTRKKSGDKWIYKGKEGAGKGGGGADDAEGGKGKKPVKEWNQKEVKKGDPKPKEPGEPEESKDGGKDSASESDSDHMVSGEGFEAKVHEHISDGNGLKPKGKDGDHPHAGKEGAHGKVDDHGRTERDHKGDKNEDFGKKPKDGEEIDHPEGLELEKGDEVMSFAALAKMHVGSILKMAFNGIKTAAKKLEDGSWAGASAGGKGGGGDLTALLKMICGAIGFTVRVAFAATMVTGAAAVGGAKLAVAGAKAAPGAIKAAPGAIKDAAGKVAGAVKATPGAIKDAAGKVAGAVKGAKAKRGARKAAEAAKAKGEGRGKGRKPPRAKGPSDGLRKGILYVPID